MTDFYKKLDSVSVIIFLYFWLLGGIYAMIIGFDRSYDFTNYHLYNPWAFLTDRLNFDVMPACVESYFNPYLDILHYFGVKYLNNFPYLFQFLDAIFYAIFGVLVYKLCFLFFKDNKLFKWLAFVVGSTSALAIYSISSPTNDLILADLSLLIFYLLFIYVETRNKWCFFFSAFIAGLSTVFRLTNGVFVFPIGFALFFTSYDGFKSSFRRAFTWMFVAFLSFLILDASWLWKIYSIYHNPFFPYFNNIFHSEFVNPDLNILKLDFAQLSPHGWFEYLFYPLLFGKAEYMLGFEKGFTDYRISFFYSIAVLGLLLFAGLKYLKKQILKDVNDKRFLFLLIFFVILYPLWVYVFANARYILFLYPISGIVLYYFFQEYVAPLIFSRTKKIIIPVLLACFVILSTKLPSYSGRVKISDAQYKILEVEDAKFPDDSYVIVQCGHAFLSVFQNPNAHYVYSNNPRFTDLDYYIFSDTFYSELRDKLKNSKVYFVFNIETAISGQLKLLTKGVYNILSNEKFNFKDCKLIMSNSSYSAYVVCSLVERFNNDGIKGKIKRFK